MTPADYLKQKTILPTELRTRELSRLPLWTREQSFFMAGVTNATLAGAFRDAAVEVAAGRLSEQEALREIRAALKSEKYQPAPGQEGSIKDLSTVRRQMVSLQTAVALARGWTKEQEQRAAGAAYPAQELYRAAGRKRVRLWEARLWPAAVEQRNAAHPELVPLRVDVMIAPVGDPIWVQLSDFGVSHDPLKYGSGMRRRPVGFIRTRELGLLPRPVAVPEPLRSPGERLEVTAADWTPAQRQDVERKLEGLAEFTPDGTTLQFTDPNGTRPYEPAALARLLSRPNVDGTENYQRAALREWVALGGDAEALAAMRSKYAGRDILDDFNRLTWRMEQAQPGRDVIEMLTELAGKIIVNLEG